MKEKYTGKLRIKEKGKKEYVSPLEINFLDATDKTIKDNVYDYIIKRGLDTVAGTSVTIFNNGKKDFIYKIV
jgi:riboflavin synthase alpha subunit